MIKTCAYRLHSMNANDEIKQTAAQFNCKFFPFHFSHADCRHPQSYIYNTNTIFFHCRFTLINNLQLRKPIDKFWDWKCLSIRNSGFSVQSFVLYMCFFPSLLLLRRFICIKIIYCIKKLKTLTIPSVNIIDSKIFYANSTTEWFRNKFFCHCSHLYNVVANSMPDDSIKFNF